MKIKSVTFAFENCESLTYTYPDLCYFQIHGEYDAFSTSGCGIYKYKYISAFEAIVKIDSNPIDNLMSITSNPNSRLSNDITQIIINYEDGSSELYLVKWPDDGDMYYHSGQTIIHLEKHIRIISKIDESFNILSDDQLSMNSFI